MPDATAKFNESVNQVIHMHSLAKNLAGGLLCGPTTANSGIYGSYSKITPMPSLVHTESPLTFFAALHLPFFLQWQRRHG
jgi:hypothetical protein